MYELALLARGERRFGRELSLMRRLEDEPLALLRERQANKLAMVLQAAGRTRFYPVYWGQVRDVSPEEAPSSLAGLPLLEKGLIRDAAEKVRAPYSGRVTRKRSGGSTGEPLTIVKNASGVLTERAASWLAYGWAGVVPGAKSARFWGTPLTVSGRWKARLGDLAMNRIQFSAFHLSPSDLDGYWARCMSFQPEWLYGYSSFLELFARHLEHRGIDGRSLGLRLIVATAEPLSEEQASRLHRVFGAVVQDEYGCGEVGPIAYSCESGAMHLMTENVYVEILREDGRAAEPGEDGEVVVTDLNNLAMPLVRYRLRDFATVAESPCRCGRPWPTLNRVLGREYDTVFTPSGERWHGTKVKYMMVRLHEEKGGFDQFQVVQVARDALEIRLVAKHAIGESLKDEISRYVSRELGGMAAEVVRVDRIARAPSGKLQVVKNEWGGKGQ